MGLRRQTAKSKASSELAGAPRPDAHRSAEVDVGGQQAPAANLPRHYLHPGEVLVCEQPSIVTTILGSCVGVVLHDPRSGIGGINHYLLPRSPKDGPPSARFGDVAMQRLLDGMIKAGASVRDMQAKVFGGARVLNQPDIPGRKDLGTANFELAFKFLEDEHIRIAGRDVGGRQGRKLMLHSHLSDVWVKLL